MLLYKYKNEIFLNGQHVTFDSINDINFNNKCKCELVNNVYATKIISLSDINKFYLDELGNNKYNSKYYIKSKKINVEENINNEFKLYRIFLFSIGIEIFKKFEQ